MFHVGEEFSRGEPLAVVVELGHVVQVLACQRPSVEGDGARHLAVRRSPAQGIQQRRLTRTLWREHSTVGERVYIRGKQYFGVGGVGGACEVGNGWGRSSLFRGWLQSFPPRLVFWNVRWTLPPYPSMGFVGKDVPERVRQGRSLMVLSSSDMPSEHKEQRRLSTRIPHSPSQRSVPLQRDDMA